MEASFPEEPHGLHASQERRPRYVQVTKVVGCQGRGCFFASPELKMSRTGTGINRYTRKHTAYVDIEKL